MLIQFSHSKSNHKNQYIKESVYCLVYSYHKSELSMNFAHTMLNCDEKYQLKKVIKLSSNIIDFK